MNCLIRQKSSQYNHISNGMFQIQGIFFHFNSIHIPRQTFLLFTDSTDAGVFGRVCMFYNPGVLGSWVLVSGWSCCCSCGCLLVVVWREVVGGDVARSVIDGAGGPRMVLVLVLGSKSMSSSTSGVFEVIVASGIYIGRCCVV